MEAFIRYKNTDICLDFHCSCGEHNHYDGYFAYEIACGECGKKFKLSDKIQVTELSPEESKGLGALEPIKFNENGEVIELEEDFRDVKIYPNYKTDVVLFGHDEITKGYIEGEALPEILEPSTVPGNWMKVRDELNNFLKNSPGVFTNTETAPQFLDICLQQIPDEAENYKALLPEIARYYFPKGATSYKGITLEFSEKIDGDQYYFTQKN